MQNKLNVKITVNVNLQHFVAATIHVHIQQSAFMAIKCNMKLVTLDSNVSLDVALSENVHSLCNATKNVKLTKIVKISGDAVVKDIVLIKLYVKVIKQFMIIVIAPVSV